MRGGGSYYSFVRRTHDYGFGSDINFRSGEFSVGFAGADYGFFMYLGETTVDELARFKLETPPTGLEASRLETWRYMWTYRPPTDIKAIREEHTRARGFAVGSANLSERASVNKGGAYLLRSILIDRSDVLIGFIVVDILSDSSVVLVWRTLRPFDTPIATGHEN